MMENRFKIPVPSGARLSYGVTQEVRSAGDWKCRSKPVGGCGRQIRRGITPRGDGESLGTQTDWFPTAEKNLYASASGDRTANRHR